MTNPVEITLDSPKLIDLALAPIQSGLEAQLSWLETAYGKARRHIRKDGVIYPSIRTAGEDLDNLLPDRHLGNYSFFATDDGEEYDLSDGADEFRIGISLIFFFDIRTVYPSTWETKSIENVKQDVLNALKAIPSATGKITFSRIYERGENVFAGYTHKEIDRQFTMMPFGCLRFAGELFYHESDFC